MTDSLLKERADPLLFARDGSYMNAKIEQDLRDAQTRVLGEIERLDLWRYVGELEANGFTVLPPERVGPASFVDALRETLLEVAEEELGTRPNIESGSTHSDILTRHGQVQLVEPLFPKRSIFQDAILNECALALVTYLVGESCTLFSNSGQIKGPGEHYLALHADVGLSGSTVPFPSTAHSCNAVWLLSDYSAETGATCIVPGSHRLCRHPTAAEVQDRSLYVPLEARAGSILVWHGNTWHGAIPRRTPGLRMGIIQYFGRWDNVNGAYPKLLTEDELDRKPPRLRRLLGADRGTGWTPPPAAIFGPWG